MALDESSSEREIGWHIEKTFWNEGIATEAAVAVRDLAFRRFGLSRLVAIIHPDHIASRRVAENIGMHAEKTTIVDDYLRDLHDWTSGSASTLTATLRRPPVHTLAEAPPGPTGKAQGQRCPLNLEQSHKLFWRPPLARGPKALAVMTRCSLAACVWSYSEAGAAHRRARERQPVSSYAIGTEHWCSTSAQAHADS